MGLRTGDWTRLLILKTCHYIWYEPVLTEKGNESLLFCHWKKCQSFLRVYFSLNIYSCPSSANVYRFKVNNRNPRKRFEIYPKLTMNTLELCQWRLSSVFIVNFLHIPYFFLVFLLLTLESLNACREQADTGSNVKIKHDRVACFQSW